MNSLAIATLTLLCVFGAALVGMLLSRILPPSHLSDSSRETIKVMTGLMATLAALVLGLLTASAKSSYDRANEEFRQLAAKVVLLDRALAEYGPEAEPIRALSLRNYRSRIDQIFPPSERTRRAAPAAARPPQVEDVEARLRALLPTADAKLAHLNRALELVNEMSRAGWVLTIEQSDNALPLPMLIVLVAWLAAMFVGFGLLTPRNATAIVALLIGALSVSASIFLIDEMSHPLDGMIAISGTPMRNALDYLGR